MIVVSKIDWMEFYGDIMNEVSPNAPEEIGIYLQNNLFVYVYHSGYRDTISFTQESYFSSIRPQFLGTQSAKILWRYLNFD